MTRKLALCALAFGLIAVNVYAQNFVTIDLSSWTNSNLRTWTAGYQYPTGNRTLDVGGVPMYLATFNNDPNSLGIIVLPNDRQQHSWDIPVNVQGVVTVYTLMNSAWGVCGADMGTIEVFGQNGSYASLQLTEGFNIRDHYNGNFCNDLTDQTVFTLSFGSVRLDRQKIELPASFAHDVLTHVRFSGVGRYPEGSAFLAGLTVQTAGRVDGDVDGNGCVDDADLLAVLFAFGSSGNGLAEDVNHDGVVDDADLLTVSFNFGSGC